MWLLLVKFILMGEIELIGIGAILGVTILIAGYLFASIMIDIGKMKAEKSKKGGEKK